MAYGIISLQVSGLAELKFGKNFIKAFYLALLITPPMMMIVYGHRKEWCYWLLSRKSGDITALAWLKND
jgi:hypothetical protein